MFYLGVSLTGWVTIFMTLSLGTLAGIMFMLGSKKVHYLWGLFTVTGALWGAGFYMVAMASSPVEAQFWWKIAFTGIILAPFTFLHFVMEFVGYKLNRITKASVLAFLYSVAAVFVALNLSTNLLINEMTFLFNEVYFDVPAAPLHPYFTFLYSAIVLFAYYLVLRSLWEPERDANYRKQAWYFFLGTAIGFAGASMDFLLVYGIHVHPIRNLSVVLGSFIVGFSILRFKLFNIRVVAAQFLTFFIIAFSIIRLATSASSQEILFNTLMLGVTVAVGVYLIRSVRREVEQREQIEQLAEGLKSANDKLTELDKLKSQFLSIATHELRTPLTIVRNFTALLVDGTYGKIPEAALEAGRMVFERVTDMAHSVDTYLNVSRIEQGKISYDFADKDLSALVVEAVSGMQPNAEKKHLTLTLTVAKGAEALHAKIDAPKITEIVTNLIDNSIKYTPTGSVVLTLEKVGNKARLTIKDTGVGMTQKTMQNLFKLFSPGEDSKKINPASTGVGLYISRAHAEAHKGSLTASSAGEGKGSQFVLELPISA